MKAPRIHTYYKYSNEKEILCQKVEGILKGRSNLDILDIGAGRGEVSKVLYKHARSLTLVDREPSYLSIWSESMPKATGIIGSLRDINLEQYDIIMLSHVLYYLPTEEWQPLLKRLVSSLKESGELIVVMNGEEGDWWRVVKKFYWQSNWHCNFHYAPWNTFLKKSCKWAEVSSERFDYELKFENLDQVVEYTSRACLSLRDPKPDLFRRYLTEHYQNLEGPAPTLRYTSDICRLKPINEVLKKN